MRPSPWLDRLPAPLRRWFGEEFGPVGRTLVAWPVLVVLLLTLPALLLVYQFPQERRINVGAGSDGFYLRGIFATEQGAGTDFRWLSDGSEIVLPAAPGDSTWEASLRLSGERPPGVPAPTVSVLADGQLVARFETIQAFKDYNFSFRRADLPESDLTLTIKTATFDPPGDEDNRPLGVALDSFTLAPQRIGLAQPLLPPPAYAAIVLAALGGLAGVLGRLGLRSRLVAGVTLIALGLLLVGQLRQPDVTARYLPGLLLGLIVLIASLLLLRPLVRRLYAAGDVTMTTREEQILCGIFLFGAAAHLAGVVFPNFQAHDMTFQVHRVEDILRGNFLLSVISSEWGYRRTPYPPALYILVAPFAALTKGLTGDIALPLRLLPPIIDATSVFLIFYLLRRCKVPDPAPLLAAFCYTLVPATYQLLWWGFFSNLFGQWATLAVLTLAVAHYADLARPKYFAALVVLMALALLSHPGTFVLTVVLIPLLALALAVTIGRESGRRGALALIVALAVSGALVYLLYYRHFTDLVTGQLRDLFAGTGDTATAPDERGWEDDYIRNRLYTLPFALYFVAAWVAGIRLAFQRGWERALGWAVIATLLTATLFGAVHVVVGVWVRYFVFAAPALAIGVGLVIAWLAARGRWGQGLAFLALAYCTGASLLFWYGVTIGGLRSPYP